MLLATPPARLQTLGDARLGTAFQPVVCLDTGDVLGSEALLRVEHAGHNVAPLEFLAWAQTKGTLAELDLGALERAVTAAGKAGGGVLLVNVEPSTLAANINAVIAVLERRDPYVNVVIEVTERALAADPAGLLRATEALHIKGYPIALDDVGTNPQSLALLEVIRPGIVKLDMSTLRSSADTASLHVAGAVAGYAESVGASVIAGGIETQADLMRARVLGAHLGQGSLLGFPDPEWRPQKADSRLRFAPPPLSPPRKSVDTPFSLVSRHRATHVVTADMLGPLSLAVEASVADSHLPAILLASLQHVRDVPDGTRERYAKLSRTLPVVGMVGEAVTELRIPAVHYADLRPEDPLCKEWNVVALGAQGAVALAACEQPREEGRPRTYAVTTTRDRAVVVNAAAALISRLGARHMSAVPRPMVSAPGAGPRTKRDPIF